VSGWWGGDEEVTWGRKIGDGKGRERLLGRHTSCGGGLTLALVPVVQGVRASGALRCGGVGGRRSGDSRFGLLLSFCCCHGSRRLNGGDWINVLFASLESHLNGVNTPW